jgi:hypothetical protein
MAKLQTEENPCFPKLWGFFYLFLSDSSLSLKYKSKACKGGILLKIASGV